mgnify:CR=1 FL=1
MSTGGRDLTALKTSALTYAGSRGCLTTAVKAASATSIALESLRRLVKSG